MNTLPLLFEQTVAFVLVVVILSFGLGMIMGGDKLAKKIITWEFKKLASLGQWLLKHLFLGLAKLFGCLAKQCSAKPKKKTP